jgi:hypothetical protein
MRLALNLFLTVVLMVVLLLAVGLLGGIGTVELWLWVGLLVLALVVVGWRTSRGGQGTAGS